MEFHFIFAHFLVDNLLYFVFHGSRISGLSSLAGIQLVLFVSWSMYFNTNSECWISALLWNGFTIMGLGWIEWDGNFLRCCEVGDEGSLSISWMVLRTSYVFVVVKWLNVQNSQFSRNKYCIFVCWRGSPIFCPFK